MASKSDDQQQGGAKRTGRYRGLRPHPEKLGVTVLGEGEASRPVRVRAAVEVLDWLGTLGAAGVGKLMTAAYRGAHPEPKVAAPAQPVELVAGLFSSPKPHHQALLDDLHAGAVLTRRGDTFHLERPDGTGRVVQPKTALYLIDRGALVPRQTAQASTSQTPEARRRVTNRAPGRRKD